MWDLGALAGKGNGSSDFLFGPYGWFALLILILDVYVIIRIVTSHKAFLVKLVWVLIVFFLPIIGLILYFFLGRESS